MLSRLVATVTLTFFKNSHPTKLFDYEMDRIIFFDGVCNLCNGFVQWIIRRDQEGKIHFGSLQSDASQAILSEYVEDPAKLDTIYYLKEGHLYSHSDVALEVCKDLGGLYRALYVLRYIPKFLRDAIYRFVAKNRYRFFGKKPSCMIPRPEWSARFIS